MAIQLDSALGSDCPTSAIDPFSDDFLTDPYGYHEELREAGPVVWLDTYGIYAMARHAEVHAALTDWQTFCSGRGVGIEDFAKVKAWRPPSKLLEVDPPLHTRTRSVMSRILSPAAMRKLREDFQKRADALIDALLEKGRIDAVKDLAEVFPLHVFPEAVGLRAEGRENLLPFANMVFNSFGPRNALFENSVRNARPVVQWIYDQCHRHMLMPGGFGAQVWDAYDAGDIDEDEAHTLVRSMLTAGLDTTVNGLANTVYAFACHPDQWQTLRAEPSLARPAFDEVLRWEAPVQTFFRTTTRAVEVAGVTIPESAKVLLFLGAANRDRRRFENPEVFDIRRRPIGHVAFGTGIHTCVGQLVARLEADVILNAMISRVSAIEFTGEPTRKPNNTLRCLGTLPVELKAA
ncbi:MAG: cytochrome P450 [Proteobacteria bacterium]|nr:MAG: cytochrome P450 [Pseudomonadota bacterium]